MSRIVLSTLNSTYQHTAFGLRYLYANLRELQADCEIREFTIAQNPRDIVEKILHLKPQILGLGVYIWNTRQTLEVVQILKKVAPQIVVVLGGPEISYEIENQALYKASDFVIRGEADRLFYEFCASWFQGVFPQQKIIQGPLPELSSLKLPYNLYTDSDLQNRTIYVEASRGCPYKCEYCLSSLDLSVRNFPLDSFLKEMDELIQRGARTFKFVDRTFNLSPKISTSILQFFLQNIDKGLFLHFELVPDRLPQELRSLIEQFPPGALQFEIGIQTWNPEVAANISRRQNYSNIIANLKYLKEKTNVHTHADLIVGLPGETLESFGRGFDALAALNPDEIQVGLLKRLKGTPISRHDRSYDMIYADHPPFQILKTKNISYEEFQEMNRFARYWDLIANSGNFKATSQFLKTLGSPFATFRDLANFLHTRHSDSFGISLLNLSESAWLFLKEKLHVDPAVADELITLDYSVLGKRDVPHFLKISDGRYKKNSQRSSARTQRQRKHQMIQAARTDQVASKLNSLVE